MNRQERRAINKKMRQRNLRQNDSVIDLDSLWEHARQMLSEGRPAEALPYMEKLLRHAPGNTELIFNYAACLYEAGHYSQAAEHFDQALEAGLQNEQLSELSMRSHLLAGNVDKAIDIARETVVSPSSELVLQLWAIFDQAQRYDGAIKLFSSWLPAFSHISELRLSLGLAYLNSELFEEAKVIFSEFLSEDTPSLVARRNYAATLFRMGEISAATEHYEALCKELPKQDSTWSDYLLALNYADRMTQSELDASHTSWGKSVATEIPPRISNVIDRDPGKKLGIGYVSSDFCYSAVANFLKPILENHDKRSFEIFAYANLNFSDLMTQSLKNLCDHWRPIYGGTVQEICELIEADNIDILIDLNGHSAGNVLPVFVAKPAPVQVSWLGYPNATGVQTIDYIVGDKVVSPIDPMEESASSPLRLDGGYHCYHQPFDVAHSPPPCLANGYVTFGSFNTLTKLSDMTLRLWAEVLSNVSDSRLLIKRSPLRHESVQRSLLNRMTRLGIPTERVDFAWEIQSTAGHLGDYANVDIALDTYPYSGTTTTCDALWMGVPVVTYIDDHRSSRVSASLLKQIGYGDWATTDDDEFVRCAVDLSSDSARLVHLRDNLRDEMKSSSLIQPDLVVGALEEKLREAWHRYCENDWSLSNLGVLYTWLIL